MVGGWKIWLRRLVGLLLLALYTAVLAEAVIRVIEPQALMPRYVTSSPWGVRTNIAGAQYRHVTPDVDVGYRINAQGMRSDSSFPEKKPAGRCRIAMLGDSYFMGYELDLEDTLAIQLEQSLRRQGYTVETINLSVSGYGTAESIIRYQHQGRKFSPDLVLLEWQVTDYDDNSRSRLYKMQDGKVTRWKDEYLPGIAMREWLWDFAIYRFLAENSHLFTLARERIGWWVKQLTAWRAKQEGRPDGNNSAQASQGENSIENGGYTITKRQRELSSMLIAEADRLAKIDDAKLVLLDIPNRIPKGEFSTSFDLLDQKIIGDIPAVQPLTLFRNAAQKNGTRIFFANGARHLTPEATGAMAKITAERIVEEKLLPQSCFRGNLGVRGETRSKGEGNE